MDPRRELIDKARAVARALGTERLTLGDFTRETGIGDGRVYRLFDGWPALCRAAGLSPGRSGIRLPDDAVHRAMHDAFLAAGGVCSYHKFEAHFRYSGSLFYRRGWSWAGAKYALRQWAEANAPDFPYMDQLPTTPPAAPAGGSQTVPPAAPAGAPHTAPPAGAPHAAPPAGGSQTVPPAGGSQTVPPSFETPASRAPQDERSQIAGTSFSVRPEEAPLGKRGAVSKGSGGARGVDVGRASGGARALGDAINFRALQHGPVNEHGVILLFGMVAAELGFMVETIAAGFPDCEAKRLIGPGRWERARIEFEYLSRNFRDHRHDPAGCDLIVCWEHNWPDCPLPVLDLKTAIEGL